MTLEYRRSCAYKLKFGDNREGDGGHADDTNLMTIYDRNPGMHYQFKDCGFDGYLSHTGLW